MEGLQFIHCLQAPVNAIKTKWWAASYPPASVERSPSLKPQSLQSLTTCITEQPHKWLPASALPCCCIKLFHLHRENVHLHNKWDIPKYNIFMLYLKPPVHYHSSNLSSRKWMPLLHSTEIRKLIDKLQMDHWETKCVGNCSAKIKPPLSGEKRFIILGTFSQFRGLLVIAPWSSNCRTYPCVWVWNCKPTKALSQTIALYISVCICVCVDTYSNA